MNITNELKDLLNAMKSDLVRIEEIERGSFGEFVVDQYAKELENILELSK